MGPLMLVLAGDIGGTNARLALADASDSLRIVADRVAPSQTIGDFAGYVSEFLESSPDRPERACLAIAGPVIGEAITGTNLPWRIEAAELAAALGIGSLRLINDFEAVGHGIPLLAQADLLTLQAGQPDQGGAVAIIGAGTGLGEGWVVQAGDRRVVLASEGGHASYAPGNPRAWGLFNFLSERYGPHVSWERVVSGPGLVDLFEFVAAGRETDAQAGLRRDMRAGDPGAVLTSYALAGLDPLAAEALDLFIDAYGAQAGNLALTVLATGGVYVAGGIARSIAPKLAEGGFLRGFLDKGRMRGLLERIPVRVILNPDVGLLGAAQVAAHGE